MLKHVTYLAISLGFALPATAQDASTVVATVGGTEITLGEMIITRAQLPQQYAQFPDEVLFQGILDQLVQQQLLADSVGDMPARVAYSLNNERRSLMAGEAINALSNTAVTEDAVMAAYNARFEGAEATMEFNASHLLVETEDEALAALARVEAGEEFADVARDVSTGPTGPNGGNLGWFGPGQMVPAFEQAVVAMEAGDVSAPVQTQFGWHIVTLNEKRITEQPTLEGLRPELEAEVREAAIQALLAELENSTEVIRPVDGAFDPSLLSDLSLIEPAE